MGSQPTASAAAPVPGWVTPRSCGATRRVHGVRALRSPRLLQQGQGHSAQQNLSAPGPRAPAGRLRRRHRALSRPSRSLRPSRPRLARLSVPALPQSKPPALPRGQVRAAPKPSTQLLGCGGRASAPVPQPGTAESGGGGTLRPLAGSGEARPAFAFRGARGPLGTPPATRSSGARLSQPAGRRGPAGAPGRRPPWRSPRPRAGAWGLGGGPDRAPPCPGWVADVPRAALGLPRVSALLGPRCCLGAAAAAAPC